MNKNVNIYKTCCKTYFLPCNKKLQIILAALCSSLIIYNFAVYNL